MIPVTAFAGKKVAIFGLGGSGLASASALLAGGADVIGCDDNADVIAKATRAGVPTADLRHIEWSRISALVLAPGVPFAHPAPHWSVGLARRAAFLLPSWQPILMETANPMSPSLTLALTLRASSCSLTAVEVPLELR